MYKAVFIDIDGTLLKSDETISEATFTIIQKLKEKNVLVVLVSARPFSAIVPIAEEIGLHNLPVASLNGAYISSNGKKIFNSIIDVDITTRIHEKLQQYNATPIYYEQLQWFSEFQNISTDYEQKITTVPITIQPFNNTLRNWKHKNTGPNKIQVIAKATVINEIQNDLKEQFSNYLTISTSRSTYLEVVNIEASKLNAVKLLIDHFNINQQETVAIGDNFNDKEMIAFAGFGIAMGNAPDEVKAAANYIADTNNNDGVAKALKKLMMY
jgi:Cof subfamily protein (haloacid dehalogenase superfamily)